MVSLPITMTIITADEELSPTLRLSGFNMVNAHTVRSPGPRKVVLHHRVKVKDTGLFKTRNFTGFRPPLALPLTPKCYTPPPKVQAVTSSPFLQIVSIM